MKLSIIMSNEYSVYKNRATNIVLLLMTHYLFFCNNERYSFFIFFLRSSIGGVAYVTVFNSSVTWAATFRLRWQKGIVLNMYFGNMTVLDVCFGIGYTQY